jgi:hypothetical protein
MFKTKTILRALSIGFPPAALALGLIAWLGLSFSPRLFADAWDKRTEVTFSGPVEIPGKVLTSGTYVFKLLDLGATRNIVQIFDKDEKKLYATLITVPDYRLQPTGQTVIRFEERPSNTPEAIKAWFYPGDNYGQQFVYPHTRAAELAKRTGQNVLSMPNEMTKNINDTSNTAKSTGVQALKNTEVTAVTPSGKDVPLSDAVSTTPVETSKK